MVKNILLVEDEAIIALDISLELEMGGFKVFSVDNGEAALEVVANEDIDLAVLDIKIKGNLTGVDVFLKLRELGIPAVFSTANIDILSKSEAEFDFEAKYIKKAFNVNQLRQIIDDLNLE